MVIIPEEVDLLWQATSYTPPFYQGKALAAHGSPISVIAFPHFKTASGEEISPDKLIYTWKVNGAIMQPFSGYGRDTYTFSNNSTVWEEVVVEVDVAIADGTIKAESSEVFSRTQVRLVFYENDPLYGLRLEQAIPRNYTMPREEVAIIAAPYFIGENKRNNKNINYEWRLNGRVVEMQTTDPSVVTLREEDKTGKATLRLDVANEDLFTQMARDSIDIEFGGKNPLSQSNNP